MDRTTKAALKDLRPHWDDDIIDKLNYFWTALILVVCTLTIGMKQYVGSPLQCWVPVEFKRFWEQYAEHYCFVENTYFVPMNETIPESGQERVERELGYYQWVPIVLALQAFLFVLPRLVWSMLNTQGFNVPAIVHASLEVKKDGDKCQRLKGAAASQKDVERISKYIDDAVQYRRKAAGKRDIFVDTPVVDEIDPGYGTLRQRSLLDPVSVPTRLFGYYTTTVYLLIKVAYITNVIGQLFMMNRYLAPDYKWWGFGILNDLAHGRQWHDSGHFPRVTLCDFTVRRLGQMQTYTIQCVLILNMLNEKIYLFLWWWFLLVSVLTILNLIYWLVVSFNPLSRRRFVARYLWARNIVRPPPHPEYQEPVKHFVDVYLKPDGVTLLRLVSVNAGEIACANLIEKLWNLRFKTRPPLQSLKTPATIDNEGFLESPDNSVSSGKD